MIYAPLSEFSRPHGPDRADNNSRIIAGLLTGVFYVLFALLVWWSLTHPSVRTETTEITARLLPDTPNKRALEPLPPFLAHLIKPHAEKPALPVFTIATGAPPQAPVPLAGISGKNLASAGRHVGQRADGAGGVRQRHRRQWQRAGRLS